MRGYFRSIFGIVFMLIMVAGFTTMSFSEYASPRVQLESGVLVEDITCKEDRILVIRGNGNPVCVTEKTAEKKNWKIINTFETKQTILNVSSLTEFVGVTNNNSSKVIGLNVSIPVEEPLEITVLLDKEEVFYGNDGINLVAAFPIDTVLRYDVVDSNNESVWPYHTLSAVHYSHVPIGFDKGTASIGTYQLEPGEYTVVVSIPNSTNTTEIKKRFTILDSKCCNPIDISAQHDVFIPGDEFQIYVKAPPQTPLTFNLIDPNGKITQTKKITTNQKGGIDWQYLTLSRIATPGIWTLEADDGKNSDSVSLLVIPMPSELIKKSPLAKEILNSYDDELTNKKSGYEVLLVSSLEPFVDNGAIYLHRVLERVPAPVSYSQMLQMNWLDTSPEFETNDYGIVTYRDDLHEKYSINLHKGFYPEDWLPDFIPDGQKLLYGSSGYIPEEVDGLINEKYYAHYNFVPLHVVLDENITSWHLTNNQGFRISISYDPLRDEAIDILEDLEERHDAKSKSYGGYQTIPSDKGMVVLFEGGYQGRHYQNSITWFFDDYYTIRVMSYYYTLDELIPIFDSVMK